MEKGNDKIYTLYAGVNGVGKSTIYETTYPPQERNHVNSDEILVSNGGDWRNEQDQIKAGRESVKRISHYIEQAGAIVTLSIKIIGLTKLSKILL